MQANMDFGVRTPSYKRRAPEPQNHANQMMIYLVVVLPAQSDPVRHKPTLTTYKKDLGMPSPARDTWSTYKPCNGFADLSDQTNANAMKQRTWPVQLQLGGRRQRRNLHIALVYMNGP